MKDTLTLHAQLEVARIVAINKNGTFCILMSAWDAIATSFRTPEFWKFQAKDAVTAVIASAAFLISVTNLWATYLRRGRVVCEISDPVRLGYGPRSFRTLAAVVDVPAINTGARSRIIRRMAIEVKGGGKILHLNWIEVLKTADTASPGQAPKIVTSHAGPASPVRIPKYDALVIYGGFLSESECTLISDVDYQFRLLYWVVGRNRPYVTAKKWLKLNSDQLAFLSTDAALDYSGLRKSYLLLRSADGKRYVPVQN